MELDSIVVDELLKRAKLLEAHFKHPSRAHFTFANKNLRTMCDNFSSLDDDCQRSANNIRRLKFMPKRLEKSFVSLKGVC